MAETVTISSPGEAGQAGGPSSSPDERIVGLQRAVSEKAEEARIAREQAAAFQKRIEEMELAQMSESERGDFLRGRERSEVERLKAELELTKLYSQHPDVAPHFKAIYEAPNAEAQLLYLKGLLTPKQPSETPAATEPSDVDRNNPMRGPNDPMNLPQGEFTDAKVAREFLKSFGRTPMRGS